MQVQLSKREIKLILTLLNNEASTTTTKELAAEFQVRVRTIKYDLDNVKIWFEQHGTPLLAQRNKGFWLELSDSMRIELKNEVLQVERYELYPDQEIRIHQIITLLCLRTEFSTTIELAESLHVSKNTIVADLEKVEQFVGAYQLNLIRKNYFGYTIEGSEHQIRLLLEAIIQKEITDYDIYSIMNYITDKSSGDYRSLKLAMQPEMLQIYQKTVYTVSKIMNQKMLEQFNYSEILAIILRVTIATARMSINRTINSYKILSNQDLLTKSQELPYLLMKQVFESYHFPILEDEYIYIFSDILMVYEEKNIAELTRNIIEFVSEKEKSAFNEDKQLFTNLFAHLSLKLHKKYLFVNEYNPFIEDIKSRYPVLFRSIEEASANEISKSISITNDSFIAYIALHFLVSYEKLSMNRSVARIVYVCSTGLGVTSLIQQRIMEEVANVEIASFASVLKAKEIIQLENPDLVVSIFPIEELEVPFIKVNPIPTKSDIQTIKKVVAEIVTNQLTGSTKFPKLVARRQTPMKNNDEEQSRELILKGFVVYEELKKQLGLKLQVGYEEAFLLHVFMMVHRIFYDSQYENEGNVALDTLDDFKEDVRLIKEIFAKNELSINKAEITALVQYISS
ncbi:transcriptional antiterminator [Carnobacterium maltaromaticum]|uniref:BglG family transcription antiterminator n=1 Tax=Carnobacterium maltaromaticum TaxID=2751 RepID=UPI000C791BBE|nr:PRD domain-containing protein [Carnobacterium maltaromaticum]PLS37141.1 transcriptional antiterminator [Carnobacterium maltaromaticum]PLS37955.1 transcriptional antiterminator [Carnobacterium maltaromaticum]PLS39896.1 transcriptional antiterminator [Carnobacterium maltaromaticum]PLS44653.1 transcriptional antiterminator [Carnobacterium maltaromaticum]PLS46685.1 transcriptional antiterminator [Carnobacterium maltaromaticum]